MATHIHRGRFGANLHRLRTAIPGMTQKRLQLLYNGNADNNSFINKLEQRDAAPGPTVIAALARALDCAESALLVGVPDRGPQMSQGDRSIMSTPPASEEIPIVTDPQLRNLLDRWSTDAALRTIFTLWRDLTPSQRHELASHALTMTAPPVQPPQRKK